MLVAGKKYVDREWRDLPVMNASDGIGDFWCARLGDGRYYQSDGKCVAVFGRAHDGFVGELSRFDIPSTNGARGAEY